MAFEELAKQARALSPDEKAALARILIEELDTVGPNTEQLWLEEVHRRYSAFLGGELKARPGDEAMRLARNRTT